jgi:nitric oxide synthase oxygenase domain/subunit
MLLLHVMTRVLEESGSMEHRSYRDVVYIQLKWHKLPVVKLGR